MHVQVNQVNAAFLHSGATRVEDTQPGTFAYYQAKNRDAVFSVLDTEWGTSYGVRRPAEEMIPYTAKVLPDDELAAIFAWLRSLPPPPPVDRLPALAP